MGTTTFGHEVLSKDKIVVHITCDEQDLNRASKLIMQLLVMLSLFCVN